MMKSGYCLLLLLAVLSGSTWGQSTQARATKQLLERLRKAPEGYDPAIRPSIRSEHTDAEVQILLRDIDVDDVNMEANFDITFRMVWKDHRLNYVKSSGVDYVTILDPTLIWRPDAFFKNALVTHHTSIHPENYVRVFSDGRIIYSVRLSLLQSCPMDLSRFPHDVQNCFVKIASYGYTTDDIVFKFAQENGVRMTNTVHADRFRIEKHEAATCDSVTSTGRYSCLGVDIQLRREFGSYFIDWYIPVIFLVVISWFSFLVPPQMFIGRLLLTLLPPIALADFSFRNRESMAVVPYVRAQDIFTGISLCIMFLTLVYVIICYVKSHKPGAKEDEEKTGSAEDGEVKTARKNSSQEGGLKGLYHRLMQRAEWVSKITIISAYLFFLFVYFVAYCGTG